MVVTVVLRVRAAPSDWGLSLCVVGNLPSLSSWGTMDVPSLPLHSAGEVFTRTLSLPANMDVEYKYVLVDDGKIVRWEELQQPRAGVNRKLYTGEEGDTVVVDDGIFGNDEQKVVNRVEGVEFGARELKRAAGPAVENTEKEKGVPLLEAEATPDPCVEAAREALALAEQLEAARTNVECVRAAVRSLRGISPSSTVDEEAAYPPSTEREPLSSDATVATQLVQHCVSDGAVLVKAMRTVLGADGTRRTKRRCSQSGAHTLAAASLAACAVLFVALVLFSPQVVFEARRRLHAVSEVVRGSVGEKGWREVFAVIWKKVKEGFGKAKEQVCEKAGWPKICGEKKVPVTKVIEAEVVGVTRELRAWLEDTVRAITGRRKPTAVESAWMWVPRPVRRLVGARP